MRRSDKGVGDQPRVGAGAVRATHTSRTASVVAVAPTTRRRDLRGDVWGDV
jgi:hypothetical protein